MNIESSHGDVGSAEHLHFGIGLPDTVASKSMRAGARGQTSVWITELYASDYGIYGEISTSQRDLLDNSLN